MSKLFSLKKWLTIDDAEKYLTVIFGEAVSRTDILRLVLDEQLTLSANFINGAYAIHGEVVDIDNADSFMSNERSVGGVTYHSMMNDMLGDIRKVEGIDMPPESQPYRTITADEIRDGEFFNNREFSHIEGVWDLVMSGDNKHNIEHEYQYLTNGPEVTLMSLDGIYLEKPDGTTCNLQVSFDENEYQAGSQAHLNSVDALINFGDLSEDKISELRAETDAARDKYLFEKKNKKREDDYHSASQLPDDAVLVIRTGAIQELISRLDCAEDGEIINADDYPNGCHIADTSNHNIQELANKAAAQFERYRTGTPSKRQIAKIIFDSGLVFKKYGEPADEDYIERQFKSLWLKNRLCLKIPFFTVLTN
ncbi:MAG TPA: hypothetical protein DCL66_10555 [Gammaproteobacteria bacterium]|nr:hypothetical protein [Gammaproteobacteria bacterium]